MLFRSQTRPDLAFDELLMSTKQKEPTIGDVKKINKMAAIARDPDHQLWLKYAKIESDVWYVTVFTDASLGNITEPVVNEKGETVTLRKSALGHFITMSAGYHYQEKDRNCPITWGSVVSNRVANSTQDAELLGASFGADVGLVVQDQIVRICNLPKIGRAHV